MHTFSCILKDQNPLCCIVIHKIANIKSQEKKIGFFQLDDILAQYGWQQMCFENRYSCLDTAISVSRESPK